MTACTGALSGGMFGWVMWPIGMILMVGFWALVIWAGLRFYRTWAGGDAAAERVLARRFAEGDIDGLGVPNASRSSDSSGIWSG